MSYRGINMRRVRGDIRAVNRIAGQRLTWRRFVSASAVADGYEGDGELRFYSDMTITGVIRRAVKDDMQESIGLISDQHATLITPFALGSVKDEVVWNAKTYRVESDSVPDGMGVLWTTNLSLGDR